MIWHILIPILTFIGGIALGGYVVGNTMKKQMSSLYSDPSQIQNMARAMGMNLNQKQLNSMTRKMQNQTQKKPNAKSKKK